MKKFSVLLFSLLLSVGAFAQIDLGKDMTLKIYGHVRTDFYYNSRNNVQSVDGLFYSYPMDEVLDANGNDINGSPDLQCLLCRNFHGCSHFLKRCCPLSAAGS